MSNLIKKLFQFVKFGLVGVSNTLISLAIYYGLIAIRANYLFASYAGYIISSVSGYLFNKLWVFKNGKAVKESIVKYYIVYISSLIINMVSMYVWVDILLISSKVAPILTLCITVPYNYLLSKFWAFREN